jgi:hypothetical protein
MRFLTRSAVGWILAVAACGSGIETSNRPAGPPAVAVPAVTPPPPFMPGWVPNPGSVAPPDHATPPYPAPPCPVAVVPPRDPAPVIPPPGTVLFAFKAGVGNAEQIWLWLDDNRLHRVSTWPSEASDCLGVYSTSGYEEGSGRFGLLHFVQQGRFLLTLEKTADRGNGSIHVNRLVRYELATGKVDFIPLGGSVSLAASSSTTLVALPTPESDYNDPKVNLFELEEGTLVPAPGAPAFRSSALFREALDVAGDLILVRDDRVLRRRQGVWREVVGVDSSLFLDVKVAPAQDAVCLVEYRASERLVWLLTADEAPLQLPCEGQAESCAFSPDGSLLYVSGCDRPVITRAGRVRSAPRLSLFGNARLGTGASATTLGVVRPRQLAAFDWSTLRTVRLPSSAFDALAENCDVGSIKTPASGSGIALLEMGCWCVDGDCSFPFAFDIQSRTVLPISAFKDSAALGDSILLGPAMITSSNRQDDPATILWTNAGGATKLALPGVVGSIHGAVAR